MNKNSNFKIEDPFEKKSNRKRGNATKISTMIGLAKNILGSGIVAMPQIMLYASILPCFMFTFIMFILSMYGFYLIGLLCHETNCKTYKNLWEKAYNGRFAFLVDIMLCGTTFGALISYNKLCGDFGAQLFKNLKEIIPSEQRTENAVILYSHLLLQFLILPESLNQLRYASYLGILAIIYFTFYTLIVSCKYLIEGVPEIVKISAGPLSEHIWVWRVAWLAPAATLGSTFMCHYNAPRFFYEMKDVGSNCQEFKKAVLGGFFTALIPNILVMTFGFLPFTDFMSTKTNLNLSGNILKMYEISEGHDSPALIICGTLYLLNVLCSYPMLFVSFRDSILNCIYKNGYGIKQRLIISEILFLIVLGISLLPLTVDDVIRWKGALFAPFIMFIVPSLLATKLLPEQKITTVQNILNVCLIFIGIIACLTSSTFCISKACNVSLFDPSDL